MEDSALVLLLQLLELATPQPESAGTLRLEVDASAILGEVAPPDTLAAFDALLDEVAQSRASAEALLPRLHELASALAVGAQAERVAALAGRLQTLAALGHVRPTGALTNVTLDLATSPLAALVTAWHLPSSEGETPITVVNLDGLSRADRVVRAPGKHYVARRVRLRYRPGEDYPLVEIDALSTAEGDPAPQPRDSWRPQALPANLRIFTEQERLIGQVCADLATPPASLRGGGLELLLPAPAGACLLATELLDQREQPLLRVLSWPPQADARR